MERKISQKDLAAELGLTRPFVCKLLKGQTRPTAGRAVVLEKKSGIGRMTWLFAKHSILKNELERVYGKISFRRGRPKKTTGEKR